MSVQVYVGDAIAAYGFGGGHPFGTDRLGAFWAETRARRLDRHVTVSVPIRASDAALARFHTQDYIDRVKQQSATGTGYLDYGDTPAFAGAFESAAHVVGSTLAGVDQAISGGFARTFVPIAGLHHARRERAAGFCVFNDIGVAIAELRARHGIRRIAYVDIDAHHGDGVFYAFEDDAELIFADIHEDGRYLYPGTGFAHETGKGAAVGTKLNIPLPPGADDAAFMRAWEDVEAFVRAGRPEIILLQAGADSIADDPLTHLRFSPAAHAHAATRLCRVADEFCQGCLIATGGGGYNRRNLALGWNAVLEALLKA